MKYIVLVVAVLAALSLTPVAQAKSLVSLDPSEGELGTIIEMRSERWTPNAVVEILAAVSPDGTTPGSFNGPLAVSRADSEGRWSVRFPIETVGDFVLPSGPSLVYLRAQSGGTPIAATGEVTRAFALIEDSRRPSGAGGVNLTVAVEGGFSDESFYVSYRRVGDEQFVLPSNLVHANPRQAYEQKIRGLHDGDWEVLVLPVHEAQLLGGPFDEVEAVLCQFPACSLSLDSVAEVVRVTTVSVQDGEVSAASVVLGRGENDVEPPSDQDRLVTDDGGGWSAGVRFGLGIGALTAIGMLGLAARHLSRPRTIG